MIKKTLQPPCGEQEFLNFLQLQCLFLLALVYYFLQITKLGSVIAAKATLGDDKVEVAGITLIALAHGFAIVYF
jgi:hypothetical protein